LKGSRLIRVQIPPGVDQGTRLRIRGQGNIGQPGRIPGDIYLDISLRKHPFLERLGDDLLLTIRLNPRVAKRGTTLEIPTLTGKISLKIPGGTASGKVFTLKGQGMPSLQGRTRGDQIMIIEIEGSPSVNSGR
jgi:molecular chaperone DnaJ